MKYEIVRMPTDQNELHETLMEYTPFLNAMYSEADEAVFGPANFILDHWLFLWDNGAGYFLVGRENDEIQCVAMLTQYKDLWHGRLRVDIHRFSVLNKDLATKAILFGMVDYLKSVASLLGFDLLFFCTRDEYGNEVKELIWNKGA